jgi:hypothetical protein
VELLDTPAAARFIPSLLILSRKEKKHNESDYGHENF